jgi:hypothetical protein
VDYQRTAGEHYTMANGTGNQVAQPQDGALSERGRSIAMMYFEHVERQVALAVTKASILVVAGAFVIGAYVKAIADYHIFLSLYQLSKSLTHRRAKSSAK